MLLQKKITIHAPAKQVFDYWANFKNFQRFIPIIERIDMIDDRRSRWFIQAPLGHEVVFESVITCFEPDKKLVWESRHADGFARGELRLTKEGESTLVELDFDYTLHRGWMQSAARLVSHFGFPSLAFDHGLTRIKQEIERDRIVRDKAVKDKPDV